ncbi:MAG: deoxyribose-phosphate aldolase [Bacteroidetes bacterium]|nr:MAG: deoxyribose-phosphate aldolase [Bacteroidota bacterium]
MNPIQTYIEHSNLGATIKSDDVEILAKQAIEYEFVGICVPPYWVQKAKRDLENNPIALVTVIGFPLGYQRSEIKLVETEFALTDGATEIDVVMNISAFKTGVESWVKGELASLAKKIHQKNALLKVILETAYLSDEEIVRACKISEDAGADFVKTSTGFASAGASVHHIQLMRASVSVNVGIKASGGIKNLAQAKALIEAGADRLGTSSGIKIMDEAVF